MNTELIFPTCLLNKTKEEGKSISLKHGYKFRLAAEDGENYFLTQDFNTGRINVSIENNIIVNAYIG